MTRFLIDARTVTSFWVTAGSEQDAIRALYALTKSMERFQIGDDVPIELIDFTINGEAEIIEQDREVDDDDAACDERDVVRG